MVEVSPDLNHGPSHLLTFPRPRLSSELVFITSALLCNLFPIDSVLLFVPVSEHLIEVFPHISDDSGDFSHAQIGMLLLDLLIDVHAV